MPLTSVLRAMRRLLPVNVPSDHPHPVAVAMQWVSVITTAAALMVLPGLAGQWLDRRWGTQFLVLAGFALGLTAGCYYLLAATRRGRGKGPASKNRR